MAQMMIFSGNANPKLAQNISDYLGIPLGDARSASLAMAKLPLKSTKTCAAKTSLSSSHLPAHQRQLNGVSRINGCPSPRQRVAHYRGRAVLWLRPPRPTPRSARVPITAKVVADMMVSVGVDRVLTVDLHADQIQGFFDVAVDNIYATPVLLDDIQQSRYEDLIVVSPDIGGVVRARAIAKQLDDADLAIIDKRRPKANQAEVMNIIGDVAGRTCIIVDDIVDTAGTLCNAAKALKEKGAKRVVAYCTHPVLSGNALNNLSNSALDEMVVTDTIPLQPEIEACGVVRVISVSELIGEAMRRVSNEESISAMFR